MIEVKGLTKIYGEGPLAYHALRGIDLEVHPGQIVMLVGPSGSGKTTLLSVLGCVLTATEGSVRLGGVEISGMREAQLPRMRLQYIGFVFQSYNLLESLTALENVALPLRLRGWSRKAAEAESQSLLEAVGLGEAGARLPSKFSGGQLQRVAIARALAGRPPILLADEPTAALDGPTGAQVMELFAKRAREGGHTVVVVTHDPRIFKFADRICHIEDGRMREDMNGSH